MALTTVTVTATYKKANGEAASGTILFQPTPAFANTTSNLIVAATQTVTLDSTGSLSVTLYATDDADTSPTGTTYTVTEKIHGGAVSSRSYKIEIPHDAAGGTVDLADLVPVSDQTLTYGLSQADLDSHTADTTAVHGITDTAVLVPGLRLTTGIWYGPLVLSSAVNTITVETIRGGLLRIERSVTVDRIRAEVTSAGTTGSVVRLGIYRVDDGLESATLVVDAGTIDGTLVAIQDLTTSQTLTPGLYALVASGQGSPATQPTMRRLESTGTFPWQGAAESFMAANGNIVGTSASGALPASTFISRAGTTQAPLVQVRIA